MYPLYLQLDDPGLSPHEPTRRILTSHDTLTGGDRVDGDGFLSTIKKPQ